MSIASNVKILERADPILHGVGADHPVPVQFIYRKVDLFSGDQGGRQADILDVGVGAKSRVAEAHGDTSSDAAAESSRVKVRNHQALIVEMIAAVTVQSRGVELHVGQRNSLTKVITARLILARSQGALAADVDGSRGNQRLASNRSTQPR